MWSSNAQASNAQMQGMIALLCASLIGCAPIGWSRTDRDGVKTIDFAIDTMTIAAIKQTPVDTSSQTKIVQLKGKVNQRTPLLSKTAYELEDTTGSLWVVATDAIPNVGDEVVIKGKLLYQSISLNGKEEGSVYIEQQQQLQRTPAMKSDRGGGMKANG